MSRKGPSKKRQLLPDPMYGSLQVAQLINKILLDGKKSIEETGGHIGLINTYLRLYYYSNGAIRVSIRNEAGAVVTMTIPDE